MRLHAGAMVARPTLHAEWMLWETRIRARTNDRLAESVNRICTPPRTKRAAGRGRRRPAAPSVTCLTQPSSRARYFTLPDLRRRSMVKRMPRVLQPTFRTVALLLALAASGCATMDKGECLAVDWRTVGYEDGVAGRSGDRIGRHRKACAKHGVTPDLAEYQRGREEGLREYCRPVNGFRLGAQGGSYGGLCPADLDGAFVSAYEAGRQLYTLESRLANANYQLDARRRELHRAEEDIVTNSAKAISGDATAEERAQAVVDVKNLAERAGRLKNEIRRLEEDRVHYERDLEDYRATLDYVP